ncbi:LCP family protein [Amycolatopsis aidingensis]|uniref:LCP family protein n=1 Tax=Amycolatopsis aidingensis TaxID=2842453 RepID=UPI001C0D1099|nr:LCP family protein [Amycolatopsis aidingensis]
MNRDHTEQLIREACAEEAGRAVSPELVRAELDRAPERGRTTRRRGPVLAAAAATVVIAGVAAVVVPQVLQREEPSTTGAATAPPAQHILLAGLDEAGNPDAIALARVASDGVATVSIPRDSWVVGPWSGGRGIGEVHAEAGMPGLVDTVSKLTGVRIDHYATMRMAVVGPLSEAVGGVPVCLNRRSSDPITGATFPAGRQTLAGSDALAFLRQRHGLPHGDLDRIVRQQVFLRSLLQRVDEGAEPAAVLATVREGVRTDPGWDLLGFAERLRDIPLDNPRAGPSRSRPARWRPPAAGSRTRSIPRTSARTCGTCSPGTRSPARRRQAKGPRHRVRPAVSTRKRVLGPE